MLGSDMRRRKLVSKLQGPDYTARSLHCDQLTLYIASLRVAGKTRLFT
jgi:hypothetical protein